MILPFGTDGSTVKTVNWSPYSAERIIPGWHISSSSYVVWGWPRFGVSCQPILVHLDRILRDTREDLTVFFLIRPSLANCALITNISRLTGFPLLYPGFNLQGIFRTVITPGSTSWIQHCDSNGIRPAAGCHTIKGLLEDSGLAPFLCGFWNSVPPGVISFLRILLRHLNQ